MSDCFFVLRSSPFAIHSLVEFVFMKWTQRIVNALRSGGTERPRPGLTPSRLLAILKEADDGSLSAPIQLFEEMEEKDPHLYAVANTRRLALTGLEWQGGRRGARGGRGGRG